MQSYAVTFSARAISQLDNLYAYIADRSGPSIADRFVDGIVQECKSLETLPERGTRRDDIRPGLRTMGHARGATIAFAADGQTATVVIHGVFYGGQRFDLPA